MMNRRAQLRAGQQQVLLARAGDALLVAVGQSPWQSIEIARNFGDSILCGLNDPIEEVLCVGGLTRGAADKLGRAWRKMYDVAWPRAEGPHFALSTSGLILGRGTLGEIAQALGVDPSNLIATRMRVVGCGRVFVAG